MPTNEVNAEVNSREFEVKGNLNISIESIAASSVASYVSLVTEDKRSVQKTLKTLIEEREEVKSKFAKKVEKRIVDTFKKAEADYISGCQGFNALGMFGAPKISYTVNLWLAEQDGDHHANLNVTVAMGNCRDQSDSKRIEFTKDELKTVGEILDLAKAIEQAQADLQTVDDQLAPERIQQLRDETIEGITRQQLKSFKGGDRIEKLLRDIVGFRRKQDGKLLCLGHKS